MSSHTAELHEHATAASTAVGHLSRALAGVVADRAARVAAAYRAELRRIA